MSDQVLPQLPGLVKHSYPFQMYLRFRQKLRAAGQRDHRLVSLKPDGPVRGHVLLSFINAPFFLKPGQPVSNAHTHHWEARQMAQTYLDLGYAVDVIHYLNSEFIPRKRYSLFIDSRFNLERIGRYLDAGCVKIMHADTAHWVFHNLAEAQRLYALQQRRQVALRPRRYMQPNWAIEHADCVTVLGNEFTLATYRYAGKPLFRIPISIAVRLPWPEHKDFEAARKHYLWFGSGGLVHKGLDRVLEVFAAMPDYELTICGPIEEERDFVAAYRRELFETPNIHTYGWVDVDQPEFAAIANRCVGLIFPSCSEGGGASVITCMNAGLIPIVNYETSVDVPAEAGLVLADSGLETMQAQMQWLSAQPVETLRQMARNAWEFTQTHHTRELFAENYRQFALQVVNQRLPSPPATQGLAGMQPASGLR